MNFTRWPRFTWHTNPHHIDQISKEDKVLYNYCLVDFASLLGIVYPANVTLEDPYDYCIDPYHPENIDIQDPVIIKL